MVLDVFLKSVIKLKMFSKLKHTKHDFFFRNFVILQGRDKLVSGH
jgi:hypothetical protein